MSIKQELEEFIGQRGLTQSAVARGIGVSPAVVSQYLKGVYQGDVPSLERKLGVWLERERDKVNKGKLQIAFVETSSANWALSLLQMAHQEGEAVVLYGQAGLGKTRVLAEYHKRNPDALLLDTDPSYTAKILVKRLAELVGTATTGSLNDVMDGIIGKLKGSERLIMVDEAELLPLRALECLRRIHDKTGCGLVLAGMPRLLINLKGRRGELVQLYSRIGLAYNMGEQLSADDLLMIASHTLPNMDTSALDELVIQAQGNTRRLHKLMAGVKRMARINRTDANIDMVKQFSELLIK